MSADLTGQLVQYITAIGWVISASLGFSLGVGIAITVFDKMTPHINQWSEVKAGNHGASLIITSIIVMIGMIVYKVI